MTTSERVLDFEHTQTANPGAREKLAVSVVEQVLHRDPVVDTARPVFEAEVEDGIGRHRAAELPFAKVVLGDVARKQLSLIHI